MSTVAENVGRFRFAFTVGTAIFASSLGLTAATWVGALFWLVHRDLHYVGPTRGEFVSAESTIRRGLDAVKLRVLAGFRD